MLFWQTQAPPTGSVDAAAEFMRNAALPFDTYYAARAAKGERGEGTFSKTL